MRIGAHYWEKDDYDHAGQALEVAHNMIRAYGNSVCSPDVQCQMLHLKAECAFGKKQYEEVRDIRLSLNEVLKSFIKDDKNEKLMDIGTLNCLELCTMCAALDEIAQAAVYGRMALDRLKEQDQERALDRKKGKPKQPQRWYTVNKEKRERLEFTLGLLRERYRFAPRNSAKSYGDAAAVKHLL